MKNYIILFLTGLIVISCSRNPESKKTSNNFETIFIDNTTPVIEKFSDLFDSVDFVKLETKPKGLVGNFKNIILIDDFIIIPGRRKPEPIVIFSSDGKHYSTINKIGKGPKEYFNPISVIYDPITSGIMICDNEGKKYVWYTLEGDHIKSIPSDITGHTHGVLKNNYVIFCGSYLPNYKLRELKHSLFISDTELNLEKMFWPHSEGFIEIIGLEEIISNNNKTYFTTPYCDTIYTIKPNILEKEYVINFGKKQLDYIKALELDKTSKFMEDKIRQTLFDNELMIRTSKFFVLSNNILVFSYFRGKTIWSCYYWGNTNEKVIFDRNPLADDFFNVLYYNPYTCYKDKIVMYNEPYNILERAGELKDKLGEEEYNKFLERKPKLKSLLTGLKSSDNPVLIYCNVKTSINK